MAQNNDKVRKGPTKGVIIGIGIGVLVTLVFKKIGIGLLMGIIVAFLLSFTFRDK